MTPPLVVLVGLLALASAPSRRSELDSLLRVHPADSLVQPLRRFEAEHGRVKEGAEAAMVLGRLHYARGEYRRALDAFARAAARLEPLRKNEARYWAGLSWLGLREPAQARAVLEEVAQSGSPRRADALLGVAAAWELDDRPDRAYDVVEKALEGSPGEAAPAALERLIVLAERLRKPEAAQRARLRLLREYPHSMEAALAAAPSTTVPTAPPPGPVGVEIGAFSRPARARSLMTSARRQGFSTARVVARGEGQARSYAVILGIYPGAAEARKAGEEAARKLGVAYQLVSAP